MISKTNTEMQEMDLKKGGMKYLTKRRIVLTIFLESYILVTQRVGNFLYQQKFLGREGV